MSIDVLKQATGYVFFFRYIPSLKLTVFLAPEAVDGWKMIVCRFPFGAKKPIFWGKLAVSFREGPVPEYLPKI